MTEDVKAAAFVLPELENGEVQLAYLGASRQGPLFPGTSKPTTEFPSALGYLHKVRSGSLRRVCPSVAGSHDAASYYRELSGLLPNVREWSRLSQFPIALMAPSSRNDAEPYFSAIFPHQRECDDLSQSFLKDNEFKAGKASCLQEAIKAIVCTLPPRVIRADRVLIVDDVLASGWTAAAIVYHLRERGVIGTHAAVTIFAALWINSTGQG